MTSCCIYGCSNNGSTNDDSVHYYFFPKDPILCEQWTRAAGWSIEDLDQSATQVCSMHFTEDSFEDEMVKFDPCYKRVLKHDAVPTLFLPQPPITVQDKNLKEMILYIQEDPENNEITIQLRENMDFEEPSVSNDNLKAEYYEPQTDEVFSNKYDSIKSYSDLLMLQTNNDTLKRKIEELRSTQEVLKNNLKSAIETNQELGREYMQLSKKIKERTIETMPLAEQMKLLSQVFSESQIKILMGKKKIYWSQDDMAVGYTIRHLGNRRCYQYLMKNLGIPLPAVSSVKRWANTHVEKNQSTEVKVEDVKMEESQEGPN